MSTLIAFFDFGKHSIYVWPVYGIVVSALLISVLVTKRSQKQTITQLKLARPSHARDE